MIKASEATPNTGRVIVKEEEPVKEGIIDPSKPNEKPRRAKVVAVGKAVEGQLSFVSVGDTVVIGRYAGLSVDYADGVHINMMETDILSKD